jgi:hypothetical protein
MRCSALAPLDFNIRAELRQVANSAGLSPSTFDYTIIEVCTLFAAAFSTAGQHHIQRPFEGHLLHHCPS